MTREKTIMRTLFIGLLALVQLAGCDRGSRYDEGASRAYRAAWEKRRAGDEAGYRAALADVAKRRGTWAGDRAVFDLEIVDEPAGGSLLGRFLRQAAELAGDPSKLPPGLSGLGTKSAPAASDPPAR